MLVRKPLAPFSADASLDPWCLAPVADGEAVFFGFAVHHARTGGLAWLASTEVEELDEENGRARTRSGRRYVLGRRFEPENVGTEGLEAEIAFRTLIGVTGDGNRAAVSELDRRWVACCKAARHLGLPPPAHDAAEISAFVAGHSADYIAHRSRWQPR